MTDLQNICDDEYVTLSKLIRTLTSIIDNQNLWSFDTFTSENVKVPDLTLSHYYGIKNIVKLLEYLRKEGL